MKILATYNIKGGVGKTATAVNLAYLAAREGARTLVWDLDPQGASSYYFRIKPKIKGGTKQLIRGKRTVDELLKGTDYENLDLLPADFSYRNMDLVLSDAKKPTHNFHKLIKPLADDYDYMFLDCPPSISLVSENVFDVANALLIPMIPTTLSLRTYDQLLEFCETNKLKNLKLLPFFSMVDRRKKMHTEIMKTMPKKHSGILTASIPYASDVERMGIHRAPVFEHATRQPVAAAYETLWEEVKTHLFRLIVNC
ncbi:MAG: AAA family ATPase [Gammaproteobacteria bacterium]|nr:AAA family ATPase [Gammaproteobacteria bacterium]